MAQGRRDSSTSLDSHSSEKKKKKKKKNSYQTENAVKICTVYKDKKYSLDKKKKKEKKLELKTSFYPFSFFSVESKKGLGVDASGRQVSVSCVSHVSVMCQLSGLIIFREGKLLRRTFITFIHRTVRIAVVNTNDRQTHCVG